MKSVERCMVIEEGDPYLVEAIRAAGMRVEGKAEMYRFGELDVPRVRRILNNDLSPEPAKPPGKPPQLCDACQYRIVFEALRKQDCIVAGRHRLLHAGRAAAVRGDRLLRLHGGQPGRRAGPAPRAAARAGAPGGERHRRQHLRP